MNIRKNLIAILFIAACSTAVESASAVDAVNVITFTLTAYQEGATTTKGTATIVKLDRMRATTRDIIQAIGEAKDITFSSRAKLLLIRHSVELGDSEPQFVVRDGTLPDTDVTEYFAVSSAGDVETGTTDETTGRYRTSILSITTLTVTIPGVVTFTVTGLSTERDRSLPFEGAEISGGITSLLLKGAGQGSSTEEAGDQAFLVDGLVKLGPTRLVAPAE